MSKRTQKVGATTSNGAQTASETSAAKSQQKDQQKNATTAKASKAEAQAEVKFTEADKELFQQQESLITTNESAFLVIGQALSVIKAKDLHKVIYPQLTFKEYCNHRWGWGDKYAYKIISAYECVSRLKKALGPKGITIFPTCEAQVRPLTKLKEDEQIKYWSEIVDDADGKTITALMIEEAVDGHSDTATSADTAAVLADKADKEQKEQVKAAIKKLTAISKLVTKVKEMNLSDLSATKFKEIIDKIAHLLGEEVES